MLRKTLKTLALVCLVSSLSNAQSITHDGFLYKEVTSPSTKRIWLDRNIGALQPCIAYNDKKCFGHYYQWGRKSDGHQLPYSKIVKKSNLSTNFSGNEFISVKKGEVFDWRKQANDSLWSGNKSINNVCPTGFKVPTIDELSNEINSSNFLKLPLSGYKSFCNGKLTQTSKQGALWSSTAYERDAYYLDIRQNKLETSTSSRADAFPVRCIKQK